MNNINQTGMFNTSNGNKINSLKGVVSTQILDNFYFSEKEKQEYKKLQDILRELVYSGQDSLYVDYLKNLKEYYLAFKQSSEKVRDLMDGRLERILQKNDLTLYKLIAKNGLDNFISKLRIN